MWYLKYRQATYVGATSRQVEHPVPNEHPFEDRAGALLDAKAQLEQLKKESGYPQGFERAELVWKESLD